MIVITVGDSRFKEFTDFNKKQCEKFGVKYQPYALDDEADGIRVKVEDDDMVWKPLAPCLFRFHAINDALKKDDEVACMDGDAVVEKPIDIEFDFDIAVTVRKENETEKHKPYISEINAGVVLVKNTEAFQKFFKYWWALAEDIGDQHALNDIITPYITGRDELIDADGLKVRTLPCEKWNDYYMEGTDPYISHYKSDLKEKFYAERV